MEFLYVAILKQKWFDEEIARPKRRPTLPGFLSPEEVTRILDHTHNLKHWTILATFYATALRASELRHLKVSDIDSQRMVLHVRQAKGAFHGTCCVCTSTGAGRSIGYFLPSDGRINHSIPSPLEACAAQPENEPVFHVRSFRICSGTMPLPGMIELGQQPSFALEACKAFGIVRQGRRQDFDGYIAVEFGVEGLIHLAHAALANQGVDLVVADLFTCRQSHVSTSLSQGQSKRNGLRTYHALTRKLGEAYRTAATTDCAPSVQDQLSVYHG
jgi:hypothetical protein